MTALRILVLADARIPVPPPLYGGAERMLDLIARGLAARGHRVTLMGHPGSTVPVRRVPYPWAGRAAPARRAWCRGVFTLCAVREAARADIVLAACRTDWLGPVLATGTPLAYRFSNPVTPADLRALGGAAALVGLSRSHAAPLPEDRRHVIPNAVDLDRLPPGPGGAGLAFLGRLTHAKGIATAVAAARRAGRPLTVAGPRPPGPEAAALDRLLAANPHVRWVGEVGDADKPALLGTAAALLMPVRWPEPFGIVAAEALACGTPVIAGPHGALPEIVSPEVGVLAEGSAAIAAAIGRLDEIDRRACRAAAEARYGADRLVGAWEEVLVKAWRARRPSARRAS